MDDVQKRERAQRVVAAKLGFIRHAVVYVMVIAGLAVINNVTSGGYQWWLWAALGWGTGVTSHFLSAFLYQSGSLVDRVAKRELEKMNESDKV